MAEGPVAGLALLDRLADAKALAGNPQLPAARGRSAGRPGRAEEARQAFAEAAALSRNAREREVLARPLRRPTGAVSARTRRSR